MLPERALLCDFAFVPKQLPVGNNGINGETVDSLCTSPRGTLRLRRAYPYHPAIVSRPLMMTAN